MSERRLLFRIKQLESQLNAARRDSERLDFLLDCNDGDLVIELTNRAAIDAAMREENQQAEPCYGDPTTEIKEKEL